MVMGSCGHVTEPSDFVKGRKFLYQLNDCLFLKDSCAHEANFAVKQ
jgi:hypothetical protein